MKRSILVVALFASIFSFSSCDKEGGGGKTSIVATVRHHNALVRGATVYISYGSTEFPGEDPGAYDASLVADTAAQVKFTNLEAGDYYVYAMGMDTAINEEVKGGIPVTIHLTKDIVEIEVPVTE